MECARNAIGSSDGKWWGSVMGVGLDPELSKMVHALGSGYCPNREGI